MVSFVKNSRAEMLSGIALALGHEVGTSPISLPPPFNFSRRSFSLIDLIERFKTEATQTGARVTLVTCADDVVNYVSNLFTFVDGDGICWSNQIEKHLPTLPTLLLANGASIVAPLTEESNLENYRKSLMDVSIGVTSADYGIANTGTLVLSSGGEHHRLLSLLPPVHVCLLSATHLLSSFADLLKTISVNAPTALTCITGPSRTADIEHTVTLGVHGPREVHVLLSLEKYNKEHLNNW